MEGHCALPPPIDAGLKLEKGELPLRGELVSGHGVFARRSALRADALDDWSSKSLASCVMASSSHRREIHQLKEFLVPSGIKAPDDERHGVFHGQPRPPRSSGAFTACLTRSIACKRRSWFDGVIGSIIAEVAYPVSPGPPPADHGAEERLDRL